MKKFYSLILIALLSMSALADRTPAPKKADLADYDPDNRVVLCVYFEETAPVCGTIVIAGDYRKTKKAWVTDPDQLTKMTAVPNFSGWYAGAVDAPPSGEDYKFKPVHLKKDGKFLWDFQCGAKDAWEKANSDGDDLIISEVGEVSGECGLHYSKAGAYIYYCKNWKGNVTPCEDERDYIIKVYPPFCEYDVFPTIGGGFDNWEDINTEMTEDFDDQQRVFYYINLKDQQPGIAFKIKGGTGWSNPIMAYVDSVAEWRTVNEAFNKGKDWHLEKDSLIVFDWSDTEKFKYSTCEEVIPCDSADYTMTVKFPTCERVTSVTPSILTSLDDWKQGTLMDTTGVANEYKITVRATCNDKYKFRDESVAGWGNQIQYFDVDSMKWFNLDNSKFVVPEEETHDTIIDYSGANYRWTLCAPTAINEVFVKAAKGTAQKMFVNDQMVIMIGEDKYNVLGTKVK